MRKPDFTVWGPSIKFYTAETPYGYKNGINVTDLNRKIHGDVVVIIFKMMASTGSK